jgi:two-component system nitrate/nitrite sensor histidine kinase NarX
MSGSAIGTLLQDTSRGLLKRQGVCPAGGLACRGIDAHQGVNRPAPYSGFMFKRPRSLAAKLLLMGSAVLVAALGSITMTLWISWHLEGGAAAVNEAGRLRMQTYRLAVSVQHSNAAQLQAQVRSFDAGLELLRRGDPSRPLFVPWDDTLERRFAAIDARWATMRRQWLAAEHPGIEIASHQADEFVSLVDHFVSGIEASLSKWTTALHAFQFGLLMLTIAGAVALLYASHLFVLEPLKRLHAGLQRVSRNDFAARVDASGTDEFAELARGFNRMAEHLGRAYEELEDKVREKTLRLEAKRERLAALYEVSTFVSEATHVEQLTEGFAAMVRRIARADAVALRWADAGEERFLMLAADGLPRTMVEAEQCLRSASCLCGNSGVDTPVRVIPIRSTPARALSHCEHAGYATLVTVPLRSQHRVLGEIDLFFRGAAEPGDEDRSLFETLGQHLAAAMEGLRAAAMERETAVSDERAFIARELHDSIAQSLAFLKMQMPVLRSAIERTDRAALERVADDLDEGVRESYGDVRSLLLHFRTRANVDDISVALRSTLQKFEHQTGIQTTLEIEGDALPLDADVQIQVLHVIQEALSNVRKHAGASHVWLRVQQGRGWRFSVRDNGRGFDAGAGPEDDTHVGLQIMRERAGRVGAQVAVHSQVGEGTEVVLTLAPHAEKAAA